MTSIVSDTFENVKRLKAVGFTEEQAAEQTKIIAEIVNERLVTRQYLDERLADIRADIIKWVAGVCLWHRQRLWLPWLSCFNVSLCR
ncbi:MAG: hypothetical protein LWW98_04240 [Deltaproteobacteria bacterium]|nr:hypothetical protein [Deltaproteobacteria bacterium]